MTFKPSHASYHFVWKKEVPGLRERVNHFWAQNDRRPHADNIEERLSELLIVATLGDEIVSVSSAKLKPHIHENSIFAFYRISVGTKFRQAGLSNMMVNLAWAHLTQWSIDNPELGLKGMAWVYENPVYDRRVIPQRPNGFILTGYTQSKLPVYMKWFQHAEV